jgi:hypothetical protein
LTIASLYIEGMATARCVYWQDGEHWLGYFEEFPDYLTQGDTFDGLKDSGRISTRI